MDGSLCTLRTDKLLKAPKNQKILSVGKAKLTNKGLFLEGELDGEKVNFGFLPESLYSLTYSTKGYLEFYYKNDYFMLIPNTAQSGLIKWTLAAEEIHNLYDEKWRLACLDAYDGGKEYEQII